jgi:copper transport protein
MLAAVGLAVMTMTERSIIGAPSLLPLFETAEGRALLYLGAALAVCLVAVGLVDVWPGRATLYGLGAAAAAAMLVHVKAGHADAVAPRLVNLAAQWIHIMAVGVWIGGLAWLLLGIRFDERIDRPSAVTRFSTMAGICLGVVLATGALRALAEIGSPGDLLTTSYGTTLLFKICLVVVIALLGAMNRYRQVPALLGDDQRVRPFQWTAGSEVAVAAVILAATAVLAGLAPAGASLGGPR